MAGDNTGDTNEKILMKDHDILIALHTQVATLIGKVEGLSSQLQSNQVTTFKEFKDVAITQTELKGEVRALEGDLKEAHTRMDKMDTRWKLGDIAIAIGTIVAVVIAWFK